MGKRTEITEARAREFTPPPGREAVLWDSVVPGLAVRVRASGRRTWIVHRRLGPGVIKRTLGALDALTVAAARRAAGTLIADVEMSDDAAVPSMRIFGPEFLADCAGRWKQATRASHAYNMHGLILPAFGARRVDAIAARDVRVWFDEQAASRPASANRALAVLSSLMKHAEALGLRPEGSNPCRGLRRRKSNFEARYLTDDEFAALGAALDSAQTEFPVAAAALRFLLYTGARKSEALRLRWEHVHNNRVVLPDSKTGTRTVWLAAPARAVVAAQPRRDDCPWVFAHEDGKPVSVDKAWKAIREASGLAGLRVHDCRHNFAAVRPRPTATFVASSTSSHHVCRGSYCRSAVVAAGRGRKSTDPQDGHGAPTVDVDFVVIPPIVPGTHFTEKWPHREPDPRRAVLAFDARRQRR